MARTSFLVSVLLAFALTGTVIAGAFYLGLLPSGRSAAASPTPRPTGSFATPEPTATPEVTPEPTPEITVAPTPGGTYIVQAGDFLSGIGEQVRHPVDADRRGQQHPGPELHHHSRPGADHPDAARALGRQRGLHCQAGRQHHQDRDPARSRPDRPGRLQQPGRLELDPPRRHPVRPAVRAGRRARSRRRLRPPRAARGRALRGPNR